MDACPSEFPLSWLNENLARDQLFAQEALAVLGRMDALQLAQCRSTHTMASAAKTLVNYWLVNRKLTGYERGLAIEDFSALNAVSFWDDAQRGAEDLENMVIIKRNEIVAKMVQESITVPMFLHEPASFAIEIRANLIDAAFWTERDLEALCCGVPPSLYCDRNDLASEATRTAARSSIAAAIRSGALQAERNPQAGPGNALYGGTWHIKPSVATRWALTCSTPFLLFPDWLASGKLAEIYAFQEAEQVAAGRYTIEQAVEKIAGTVERREEMIVKLGQAAYSGAIPVYAPGEKARYVYGRGKRVNIYSEEAYWDDLNAWIAANEPRLLYAFPAPAGCLVADNSPGAGSLTHDEWLATTREDDELRAAPAYAEQYQRAWQLHAELEEWKSMKHNGDPLRAISIEERLKSINAELASLAPSKDLQHTSEVRHATVPAFVPKQRQQENAILQWISSENLCATALPKREQGKAGVKAAAWTEMQKLKQLFVSKVTFDKTWDRLRADRSLSEAR